MKNKEKKKESKIYKVFRRITSLGVAGTLAWLFPNEIIAWTSALTGVLYGKGLISIKTMAAIVTFLGSAGGLLVQKIVLAGLSFIISNVILKQGGKLVRFIGKKLKNVFKKNKQIEEPKKEKTKALEQSKEPKKEQEKVIERIPNEPTPTLNKDKVKSLGVHPSLKH